MTITDALVTHTHQDHVGGSLESWGMPGRIPGLEELLGRVKAKVRVHKAEREFLKGLGSDLAPVDNHDTRSEEHTSELQSQSNLVCRLLLEKKKTNITTRLRYDEQNLLTPYAPSSLNVSA